jgi:hypothetical protein
MLGDVARRVVATLALWAMSAAVCWGIYIIRKSMYVLTETGDTTQCLLAVATFIAMSVVSFLIVWRR